MGLTPTNITIQLADCSTRQLVGILEDVPIQVDKFLIHCDFAVLDMDKDFLAPRILGRPFLATVEAVIDVHAGTLSFQLCGERMYFSFPHPAPPAALVLPSPYEEHIPISPFAAVFGVGIFDENGESHILLESSSTCG